MEECKRMGIKVLGPDINESKQGFAVNKKGEIRFGLGGLKGVGEAAIQSIIEEREQHGRYQNVFDFIKRINQRTVNKKSLESLIYSGAFDCFEDLHRAQYFFVPKGESMNGLERIIRYGNQLQQQSASTANTLFGNLADSLDVQLPKLPPCDQWTLTDKLGHEKDVTGMFMSGHPLDHFRFELRHYGVTPLGKFNEFTESINEQASPGQPFRLAGLVVSAQHRTTRTGRNFAILAIEDYTGKAEFALWSQDYTKYAQFLNIGLNLYVVGQHKPRMKYGPDQQLEQQGWEFKISGIYLLETLRTSTTKQVDILIEPSNITTQMIGFMEQQLKKNVGGTKLKFLVRDSIRNFDIEMMSSKSYSLNEEMADYLLNTTELDVKVTMTDLG